MSINNTYTTNGTGLGTITSAAGQYLSVSSAGNYEWANINSSLTLGQPSTPLYIKGEAEFDGDITIKGVKLLESIQKIEQRLNILRVNPELESRWTELKELGERYRLLEAECLDKEYIIDILKR